MQSIFYYALILLSFVIAVWDYTYYKIPNKLLVMVALLYIIFAIYMYNSNQPILSWSAIIVAIICLLLGVTLFYFNLLGAGDAKYLCLAALWMFPIDIVGFFLITAITGGFIALIFLAFESLWTRGRIHLHKLFDSESEIYIPEKMVPYGIAISIGIITVLIKEKIYTA